jgi:DNA-binding LacI/PurR family transcriptional regulator
MDNAIVCIRTGVVEAVAARDVSDALRIAVSTVGRPLADGPQIRSETKAGVQNAALRLVYMGSTPAQEIRGGSSKLVGLVIPDLQNDFYATIAQALSHCCDAEEYHLALSITDDNRDIEARRIRELVSARVAGIIIVPTASPRKETVVVLAGVPHVQLLRRIESLDADWFGMNDEECLLEGTQHLLELGHRRIAYVGGSQSLSTGAARLRGFRRALSAAGVGADEIMEILGPTTFEFGVAAARRALSAASPPTAIITASVQITTGLMDALGSGMGLVPERVSVVGFGDPPWSKWWNGGLTTLRMPVQELATSCGFGFLHRLRTRQGPDQPHTSICPATFVVRATTGPLEMPQRRE